MHWRYVFLALTHHHSMLHTRTCRVVLAELDVLLEHAMTSRDIQAFCKNKSTQYERQNLLCILDICWWLAAKTLSWTRHSENDNSPQPIDQRMDSQLIGLQVGNSNSFASTHYLANVPSKRCTTLPTCKSKVAQGVQCCTEFTSLSFQVN